MVDTLFRESAGRLVSTLTRVFGAHRIELAEEVVQDALLAALQVWPYRGIPDNPAGWLTTVARNRALDRLRREAQGERLLAGSVEPRDVSADTALAHLDPMEDDQLRMVFLCCHPSLPSRGSIALTLKTVGGFGVSEIARAFLAKESAVAQQLVRVKRQIKSGGLRFEMPPRDDLPERLGRVLEVLYLLFNEGYGASEGDQLIRQDLCWTAIRLCRLLVAEPMTAQPASHALLALMLLQGSRLPGRTSDEGELQPLAEQDRDRWNRSMMAEGFVALDRSATGQVETAYHIEAAIAACHAASTPTETNWGRILELYDRLLERTASPVVRLNRAVALAHVAGARAGIAAADPLLRHPAMRRYALLPAILGDLWDKAGDRERAAASFRIALQLPLTDPARRFLLRRLTETTQ
ncbi:MAG: RNA polymerase subunit sigma-70 [Gemmatimonadales bacterium]|nr:RNA polymerase subunit sigma-70 [Gemmatimonadales bacterium]